MLKATISHIDTCVTDYFQGTQVTHVAAIPVCSDTTIGEVLDLIESDAFGHVDWSDEQSEAKRGAVRELQAENAEKLNDRFDPDLEPVDDECEVSVCAYFTMEFEAAETVVTTTEQVVRSMLTENTGQHMLDSGGHYGRHWQRNQGTDFSETPEATMDVSAGSRNNGFRYGECLVSVSLYHFLVANLEYEQKLDDKMHQWIKANVPDEGWMNCVSSWVEHKFGKCDLSGGIYDGSGNPDWTNTYNSENDLSQDIQFYHFFATVKDDDPEFPDRNDHERVEFAILQVHGGCDVRGGYTTPRVFRVEHDDGSFWDWRQYYLSCNADHETCGWYADYRGDWIDTEGSCQSKLSECGMKEIRSSDDLDDVEGEPHEQGIAVWDGERLSCPRCGKGRIVAGVMYNG